MFLTLLELLVRELIIAYEPLVLSVTVETGKSVEVLHSCLEKAMGWMRGSTLKLGPDKTEALLVNDKTSKSWKGLHLGVLLDLGLWLEAQVSSMAHSTSYNLWLIHQLWLSSKTMII